MKKTYSLLLAALALLTMAASCGKDEPIVDPVDELSITPASINATPAGGTYILTVTGNMTWTATDDAEWLTLSPASGEGNGTINVEVTGNTTVEARNATVTVAAGALTETVTIVQEAVPTPPPHAASTQTWTIGTQTWSDAIHIPACDKEDFENSETDPRCRSYTHEGTTYYYYNWPYTDLNAADLCPSPWRVPTTDDFVALDIALGGTGEERYDEDPSWVNANYINKWGGSYGGFAHGSSMLNVGSHGDYWSSTKHGTTAYLLHFNSGGTIYPQNDSNRVNGFQVRCVK
jgi:uncharacterized protein (TIGR02145 family)